MQRTHHSAGRAGQDGVHRFPDGSTHGEHPAAGAHDGNALRTGLGSQPGQVPTHDRGYVCIYYRGAGPFVLTVLGEQS